MKSDKDFLRYHNKNSIVEIIKKMENGNIDSFLAFCHVYNPIHMYSRLVDIGVD